VVRDGGGLEMSRAYSEIPLVEASRLDAAYSRGDLCKVMGEMAVEHGPLFRWVSNSPEEEGQMRLSMVGPEANRFVMNTHRQHFSHEIGWSPLINDAFGRGLLTMDDPEHAVHRKMWNPAFTSAYMGTYLPIMQQVIEARTATWPERGEVDLYTEAREITFDIAASALAGFGAGAPVEHMRKLFYGLTHGFEDIEGSFDDFMARYYEMRAELFGLLVGMIRERRAAPAEERPRDVLSLITHSRFDDGSLLSDEQVLGHLNILLLAGHETTTTLGAWALYLGATMPEHRKRILGEIDAAIGGAEEPSIEAIRSMKHLDNFVRETGRMYPPVVNVPRGVVEECEFAGYTIPAGTIVRLSLGGTHHLPTVWEEPERFDPDRLAAPREEDKRTPYALVTFGGGPRVCIGQHFALIETKALVAHVLRHYTLTPISGKKPVPAGFFNTFIPGGVPVKVTSRASGVR
jgi:cytochrome P450